MSIKSLQARDGDILIADQENGDVILLDIGLETKPSKNICMFTIISRVLLETEIQFWISCFRSYCCHSIHTANAHRYAKTFVVANFRTTLYFV